MLRNTKGNVSKTVINNMRVGVDIYGDGVDEVKFPLGIWKENETRMFDVSCTTNTLISK